MAYQRRIQYNMFDTYFQSSLDPHHRLVLLAAQIAWDRLTESLLCYYSRIGRRAKSIRLMAGLLILKHLYNISDERVVSGLHEPQVACIRKGKRAKPDEYGSKVLLSVDRNGYVMAHREYPSNPADSELLEDAVRDWQEAFGRASPKQAGLNANPPVTSEEQEGMHRQASGKAPKEVGADRGFHRSSYEGEVLDEVERLAIPRKGKTPHPEADRFWYKRFQRRRASIEPITGHLKADHRMDRCRYRGFEGDVINVCLAAVAWNLKKWGRTLAPV